MYDYELGVLTLPSLACLTSQSCVEDSVVCQSASERPVVTDSVKSPVLDMANQPNSLESEWDLLSLLSFSGDREAVSAHSWPDLSHLSSQCFPYSSCPDLSGV